MKSLSSLSCHFYKCPVLISKRTRDIVKNMGDQESLVGTLPSQYQYDKMKHMEDDNWVDITKDSPGPLLICKVESRLSTTASLRIESYKEVTGK